MTALPARAVVLGMARSGTAAAALLRRRGVEVVEADRNAPAGDADPALLDGAGLLVKSPGVPADHALVAGARRRGIPVWSEVELGMRFLPGRLVGVTGTNGKTTTTELLGAIFRAAGRPVEVAGNVGRALCELDGRTAADTWIVCELSSFQLENVVELRPEVAVLVNLEPDHIDRHGSFAGYRDAKLRIFENQTGEDTAVVPRGFPAVPGRGRRAEFHADDPLPAEPAIPGRHNRENAAAATAAARAAGIGDAAIGEALRTFAGVPHRLEAVGERGGVRFVNDSKATNVAAARRALAAFGDTPLHVIMGGSLKGESFAPLAELVGPSVRGVYLIGEAADELAGALAAVAAPVHRCGDLATAVGRAAAAARPGEIVLLSPACASYDQYANFERRGEDFRALVEKVRP